MAFKGAMVAMCLGASAAMPTVLVSSSVLSRIHEQVSSVRLVDYSKASSDDVAGAEAMVVGFGELSNATHLSSVMSRMVQGKLFQVLSTGTDNFNVSSVPAHFAVCNVHQAGVAIPEYVIAAVMSWNVGLPQMDAQFRQCGWKPDHKSSCPKPSMHVETKGQTIGLIGYGVISQGIAIRAAAMGMHVVAVTYNAPAVAPAPLDWIGNDDQIPRLMQESDFVVVACPLTPATEGLVNAAAISKMKASGVLINIARGPVVDEQGIYEALAQKRIGGAVIDVWWSDPFSPKGASSWPSKFNFAELSNVWMTPHTSTFTAEAEAETIQQVSGNLLALASGQPLQNVVRNASLQLLISV